MSDPFRTPEDYEFFLYTLVERSPIINRSTLVFVRVVFDRLPLLIDGYGYEIWRGDEKIYWYDSQPHPNDPALQSTHPHHKHIPPDIKHNRIPAPEIKFTQPNIPWLVDEAGKL